MFGRGHCTAQRCCQHRASCDASGAMQLHPRPVALSSGARLLQSDLPCKMGFGSWSLSVHARPKCILSTAHVCCDILYCPVRGTCGESCRAANVSCRLFASCSVQLNECGISRSSCYSRGPREAVLTRLYFPFLRFRSPHSTAPTSLNSFYHSYCRMYSLDYLSCCWRLLPLRFLVLESVNNI